MGAQYDVDLTQPGFETRLAYQLCANDEDTLMLYVDHSIHGSDDDSSPDNYPLYSQIYDRLLHLANYGPRRLASGSSMNQAWFSLSMLLSSFYSPAEESLLKVEVDELIRLANDAITHRALYNVKTVQDIMRKDMDKFPLYLRPFVTAIGDCIVEEMVAAHHQQQGTHPPPVGGPPLPIEQRSPTMALVSNEYFTFWQQWLVFAERTLMVVFSSVIDIPGDPQSPVSVPIATTAPTPTAPLLQPVTKVLRPLTILRLPSVTGTGTGSDSDSTAAGAITVRVSLPTPFFPFSNKFKTKFRNLLPQVRGPESLK